MEAKMKKKLTTSVILMGFLSACATQPSEIIATPTPTSNYSGLSCNALRAEQNRIVQNVNTLTGAQKTRADNDAAAMGVGMILFWPALFFLKGDTNAPQLAAAKGQYDAIQSVSLQKGC
jgi:hypothetical protein